MITSNNLTDGSGDNAGGLCHGEAVGEIYGLLLTGDGVLEGLGANYFFILA